MNTLADQLDKAYAELIEAQRTGHNIAEATANYDRLYKEWFEGFR